MNEANDIDETKIMVSQIVELVEYLDLPIPFYRDLELTSATLQEAAKRLTNTQIDEPFSLAIKQIKLMVGDLIIECKQHMIKD